MEDTKCKQTNDNIVYISDDEEDTKEKNIMKKMLNQINKMNAGELIFLLLNMPLNSNTTEKSTLNDEVEHNLVLMNLLAHSINCNSKDEIKKILMNLTSLSLKNYSAITDYITCNITKQPDILQNLPMSNNLKLSIIWCTQHLKETTEASVSRDYAYDSYLWFCYQNNITALLPSIFTQLLQIIFPTMVLIRSRDVGLRYQYENIKLDLSNRNENIKAYQEMDYTILQLSGRQFCKIINEIQKNKDFDQQMTTFIKRTDNSNKSLNKKSINVNAIELTGNITEDRINKKLDLQQNNDQSGKLKTNNTINIDIEAKDDNCEKDELSNQIVSARDEHFSKKLFFNTNGGDKENNQADLKPSSSKLKFSEIQLNSYGKLKYKQYKHPSVRGVFKKYPNITFDADVYKMNINVKVSINEKDIRDWYSSQISKLQKHVVSIQNDKQCNFCKENYDINRTHVDNLENLKQNLSKYITVENNDAINVLSTTKLQSTSSTTTSLHSNYFKKHSLENISFNHTCFLNKTLEHQLFKKHITSCYSCHPSTLQINNIKIPSEVNNCNINPVVVLDSGEVWSWFLTKLETVKENLKKVNTTSSDLLNNSNRLSMQNAVNTTSSNISNNFNSVSLQNTVNTTSSSNLLNDSNSLPMQNGANTNAICLDSNICSDKTYISKVTLKRKIIASNGNVIKKFKMSSNNVKSNNVTTCDENMINCSKSDDIVLYKCDMCLKSFNGYQPYAYHTKIHVTCKSCSWRFKNMALLRKHLIDHCLLNARNNFPSIVLRKVSDNEDCRKLSQEDVVKPTFSEKLIYRFENKLKQLLQGTVTQKDVVKPTFSDKSIHRFEKKNKKMLPSTITQEEVVKPAFSDKSIYRFEKKNKTLLQGTVTCENPLNDASNDLQSTVCFKNVVNTFKAIKPASYNRNKLSIQPTITADLKTSNTLTNLNAVKNNVHNITTMNSQPTVTTNLKTSNVLTNLNAVKNNVHNITTMNSQDTPQNIFINLSQLDHTYYQQPASTKEATKTYSGPRKQIQEKQVTLNNTAVPSSNCFATSTNSFSSFSVPTNTNLNSEIPTNTYQLNSAISIPNINISSQMYMPSPNIISNQFVGNNVISLPSQFYLVNSNINNLNNSIQPLTSSFNPLTSTYTQVSNDTSLNLPVTNWNNEFISVANQNPVINAVVNQPIVHNSTTSAEKSDSNSVTNIPQNSFKIRVKSLEELS